MNVSQSHVESKHGIAMSGPVPVPIHPSPLEFFPFALEKGFERGDQQRLAKASRPG